jgi:hypothetical protein
VAGRAASPSLEGRNRQAATKRTRSNCQFRSIGITAPLRGLKRIFSKQGESESAFARRFHRVVRADVGAALAEFEHKILFLLKKSSTYFLDDEAHDLHLCQVSKPFRVFWDTMPKAFDSTERA